MIGALGSWLGREAAEADGLDVDDLLPDWPEVPDFDDELEALQRAAKTVAVGLVVSTVVVVVAKHKGWL